MMSQSMKQFDDIESLQRDETLKTTELEGVRVSVLKKNMT